MRPTIEEVKSMIRAWMSHRQIRRDTWLSLSVIHRYRHRWEDKIEQVWEEITKQEKVVWETREVTINYVGWLSLITKDQFLEHIWYNELKDEIINYRCNVREIRLGTSTDNHLVKKYEHFVSLKPRLSIDLDSIIQKINTRVIPNKPTTRVKISNNGDYVAEINILDAHINKLSFLDVEWDTEIAYNTYISMVKDMVDDIKHYKPSKVLFITWHDFFNSDGHSQTTSWTPQHNTENEASAFEAWLWIIIDSVNIIKKELWCPIEILNMPWNHAELLETIAWTALKAVFSYDEDVIVNNEQWYRKYRQWWDNAIMFTHWEWVKSNDIPMIFASERPDLWANCRFKEVHHWHFHSQITTESKWVIIRSFSALTNTDKWHNKHWFVWNIRWWNVIIWHRELWNKAQLNYYI